MDLTKEIKKIDCHVHSHFSGGPLRLNGSTWATPEEIRAAYDRLGIDRGILMSCSAPEQLHELVTSRDAEAMFSAHQDTFAAWFCALDPRMITNSPTKIPNYSYYIDFYRERGARGVGELRPNLYIDDPRMIGLLSHCERSDFPITIHFGPIGTCGIADDIGLVRLEKVLTELPGLKLIAHAASFWSEISADVTEQTRHGYPKGPVVREGRVAQLMRKFPNLICDISAGSGLGALSRDPEYAYEFIDEFKDRILFGTDISSPEVADDLGVRISAFLDEGYISGNISADAYRAIARENAIRILGLD